MTTPNDSDAERELQRVEEIERNKMQDRTKAIVEAAERLARVAKLKLARAGDGTLFVSHEAVEVDDFSDEVRDALTDLAVALALPAEPAPAWTRTPPTADGHYWIRGFGAYGVARVLEGSAMFPGLTRRYDLDALSVEHEFWPVCLQEPPA